MGRALPLSRAAAAEKRVTARPTAGRAAVIHRLDGAAFPSIACQNPTITMMALTVRACEYMVAEHKRGNFA